MLSATGTYRVPKHELEAEVVLAGGRARTLRFFLSDAAETHRGPERPSDILNGHDAFLPAVDPATGEVLMLRREAIVLLAVPIEAELAALDEHPEEVAAETATQATVEVRLLGGGAARGTLRYLMPEGQRRLQDFLNLPVPFLILHDGDRARLVNKNHVVAVTAIRDDGA